MYFFMLKNHSWRIRLQAAFATWLGRALPAPANNLPPTVSPATPVAPATPLPVAAQASTSASITPITWFAALSRDLLPVLFIDTASGQLIKINGMSRKQLAEYLRCPIYTDHTTRWTSLGNELRREGFTVATAFQAQEDALLAMEALESARWYATAQLAHLDNEIHQTFVTLIAPLIEHGDDATAVTPLMSKAALANFAQLLVCRKTMSEELARIDEEAIPTLQRIGMALPAEMVSALTATRSQAPAYAPTSECAA
jgi:hypothetical protein